MKKREHIVVLTGAGMSAESGIRTFRDADGLWEGHDVMEVASPEGWRKNRSLVLDFYNQRRQQLLSVESNDAHKALADLETYHDVTIITQNIDDLHERAGSTNVIHLHGELLKMKSELHPKLIYDCREDILEGQLCEQGAQLRPYVVWFGEEVPMLSKAVKVMATAEKVMIIGTSMQVYPAASLTAYAPPHAPIYYIDPKPSINYELGLSKSLTVIESNAVAGMRPLIEQWMH